MDDIERAQAYILDRLDREPQEKEPVIDAGNDRFGDDRDIETAFEDLIETGRIQADGEDPPTYSLTDAGEVKLMFEGPAVMLAIDFVGVQDKDQLDAYLMDLYDVEETPDERSTSGTISLPITSEDWGELDTGRDEFKSLRLTVVQFDSVPLGYHVILSGQLTTDAAPHNHLLESLRIARAFTAYQHHRLVRTLTRNVTPRTSFVVAPAIADPYRDDDIPEPEDRQFLEAALALLDQVGTTFEIPVIVSTVADEDLAALVQDYAAQDIDCERTQFGYHFATDEYETRVYWGNGFFQTTIPYWVDLFGAVGEDPATIAYEAGLVDAEV